MLAHNNNNNNNNNKEHKQMTEKKKIEVMNIEQYILKKPKSTVTFTHSYSKYYSILTKQLFSYVVGYNFIFYYFILTYKKLTHQ